ncbi:polysaccharide deacetylase family protein [Colletotrichum truncatum]|uniref:Polysaccharide deacetylase family protein n=1 Tax=Colletotrichum truncatum TaxID=5467 RepID=A0ACC3YP06_COLTU|nr:polysaccharide deacetylase family protein [Colletotrichum truncatum]KAF6791491.1 polysaccharide deacetylase family protein [Colletotrichum truncatum]
MHYQSVASLFFVAYACANPLRVRNDTASAPTASSAIPMPTAPATNIPYGVPIRSCTVKGTFALTFDDGPYQFTNHVLDLLAEAGAKATFFVNGQNHANIYDNQDIVKRIISDGHQLASHTWRHLNLTGQDDDIVIPEMTRLEDALIKIVGKYPTYMRPPFFEWTANTLETLKSLEYHVIHADVDSMDWNNASPVGNMASVDIFQSEVNAGGSLALAHDVYENTAVKLVPEFLRIVKEKNLKLVSVGECLGDPETNWYKTRRTFTPTATAASNPVSITSTAVPTGVTGPDGICGGDKGYICSAGYCCGGVGYCGRTESFCGEGCNPLFGECGIVL